MMVLAHLPGHVSEIVSVVFCGQLPLACAADAAGLVSFAYTRPSRGCMQFFFLDTVTEMAYDEATSPPLRGRQFALSCIGYDEVGECVVTGDEEGRIRLWNITEMLDQLDIMQVFPSGMRKKVQASKGVYLPLSERTKKDAASSAQGGMAQVTKDCVRLKARWIAHKDVIKTIQVVGEPRCIISCGMDRRVHIWNMTGEKLGTLLQGNAPRADSWKFHHLYEEVALKREAENNIRVEECMREAEEIELEVDISIPPPTPPPRGPDGDIRAGRPGTSGAMGNRPSPMKTSIGRSKSSLGSPGSPKGAAKRRSKWSSPSRISLARQQQEAAIDPLASRSMLPTGKNTPLSKSQSDSADALNRAVRDAMLGLWHD